MSFVSGLSDVTDSFKHITIGRIMSYKLTRIDIIGESLSVIQGVLSE